MVPGRPLSFTTTTSTSLTAYGVDGARLGEPYYPAASQDAEIAIVDIAGADALRAAARAGDFVTALSRDTVPPTSGPLLPVAQKQILLSNLAAGIWELHVVSIDQRGYRTKAADHYQIRIGTDPGAGTLLGTVMSGGAPVQGAKVRINRSLIGPDQASLANGAYNFGGSVPAGTWEVSVEKSGYQTQMQTVTVTAGGSTTANFALVP